MFEIANRFANTNTPITVRFTEEIYKELKKTAKDNSISFNLLVLQCCRFALDQLKGNKPVT